jgi:hypothetical protein
MKGNSVFSNHHNKLTISKSDINTSTKLNTSAKVS